MLGFFKKTKSSNTAKQRLKSVLSMDRANVTAEFLLKMTSDIINTAVKYIEPDYRKVSVTVERNGCEPCLVAKFPIISYKEAT